MKENTAKIGDGHYDDDRSGNESIPCRRKSNRNLEAETIQQRLESINNKKDIAQLSKEFLKLMSKGNINDATLNQLRQKHPDAKDVSQDILLEGEIPEVHPVIFEMIDEEMVKQAAIKTKGGSVPSGMDADGWRRTMASNHYGTVSSDLRKAFAEMIKNCVHTKKITTMCVHQWKRF